MYFRFVCLLALTLGSYLVSANPLPDSALVRRGYPNGITKDQPLPYAVTQQQLDAIQLVCPDGVANGPKKNILFVPGTGELGSEAYAQGYIPAFKAQGYNGCYSNLPNRSLVDIQLQSEYVVNQIDQLYKRAGNNPIHIVGHSQGGLLIQWALNFWPSRREKVFSFLSLSGDFHGTAEGPLITTLQNLTVGGAPPSVWQQSVLFGKPSNFLTALSKHGDTPVVPTTSVYGALDEVIQPVYESTNLNNVPVPNSFSHVNLNEACPLNVIDHFATLLSGPAFWLGLDAFQNGIGNVKRAQALAAKQKQLYCGPVPNVGFAALPTTVSNIVGSVLSIGSANFLTNKTPKEPPLQPYAANQ
ncbi:unnamed protein product [Sympodiomycopsis kandeliae]